MAFLYEKILRPLAFSLDAETAHDIGIKALKLGLAGRSREQPDFKMEKRFGLKFRNPLGLAAGFDKNATAVNQLARLGFGFVEIGTVTMNAQPGNEKPRLFRLPKDKALINRLGFNNDGAFKIAERLAAIDTECVVGINIGRNKNVPNDEAVQNYLDCLQVVYPHADYVAVNISSPNTPNLRELQKGENLEELVSALQNKNDQLAAGASLKPLLVKIAPDLSDGEIEAIADTCLRHEIAGVIATNTTTSRHGLVSPDAEAYGPGGLSGRPLAASSTRVIRTLYRYTRGRLPIIGVGGVFDAEDAFEKIASGACLVQAYTGFVYSGPGFAARVTTGLAKILKEKGFASIDEAIGSITDG